MVHPWKRARGAGQIISEHIERSRAYFFFFFFCGKVRARAWVRLCPCGESRSGLACFLSAGDEAGRGCPLKTNSLSLRWRAEAANILPFAWSWLSLIFDKPAKLRGFSLVSPAVEIKFARSARQLDDLYAH